MVLGQRLAVGAGGEALHSGISLIDHVPTGSLLNSAYRLEAVAPVEPQSTGDVMGRHREPPPARAAWLHEVAARDAQLRILLALGQQRLERFGRGPDFAV